MITNRMGKNIIEFLGRIKKRVQLPKIYAIVFHDVSPDIVDIDGQDRGLKLHLCSAYDLDEAVHEFISNNQHIPGVWRPLLWSSMSLKEIETSMVEVNAIMTEEESEVQSLMKDVLDKKDLKMLEKNKSKLSDAQYQYLKDRLSSAKKKKGKKED